MTCVKRLKVMASRKRTVQDEKSMNQDVHQNRRAWSVHNKTSIKEQKLASLLVIIAVSYFIFTLPANVTFVLVNLPINVKSIQEIYYPLTFVTNFFESLNYAANFYIYCAVHSEIRESFLELCKAFGSLLTCADKKYGLRFWNKYILEKYRFFISTQTLHFKTTLIRMLGLHTPRVFWNSICWSRFWKNLCMIYEYLDASKSKCRILMHNAKFPKSWWWWL